MNRPLAMVVAVAAIAVLPGVSTAQQPERAWLALGDSYSSGEGIAGTNDVDNSTEYQGRDCARATGVDTDATAWAVAAHRDVSPSIGITDQMFVACTGAVASEFDAQIREAAARKGRGAWDLVTFSIGGNDINFADVLKGCLDLNSVWGAFDLTPGCDISETDLRASVDTMRAKIGATYDLVADHVISGGDVIVVGYPHLIEETGRWDRWRRNALGNCEGILNDDVGMLRSATGYLNEQLAGAVADADGRHADEGIRFHFLDISVDPYEYSGNRGDRHALCSDNPWLNGMTLGVSSVDLRKDRSFHPHQAGHTNTGRVLAQFIRDHVTFDDAVVHRTYTEVAIDFLRRAIDGQPFDDLLSPDQLDQDWTAYPADHTNLRREAAELRSLAHPDRFLVPGETPEGTQGEALSEGCGLVGDVTVDCNIILMSSGGTGGGGSVLFVVSFAGSGSAPLVSDFRSPDLTPPKPAPSSDLVFFELPSGNIGCLLAGDEARCDIREVDYTPPHNSNCELDFGSAFAVGTSGEGFLLCAGDTVLDGGGTVLAYGETISFGPFTCSSSTNGATCRNDNTGHGFSVRRSGYELF